MSAGEQRACVRDASLNMRVPYSMKEQIERAAERDDRPISSWVRKALQRELERDQRGV
jgi:hypothetical protein